jgi:hypothetical protein
LTATAFNPDFRSLKKIIACNMTEVEFKFLEVFYNRGIVPEQSFINFLNGSLPESVENKKEFIDDLFIKFKDFGFIDSHEPGTYQITALGKDKYEELSERKEIHKKLETLTSRKSGHSYSKTRFTVALIIVCIVISIFTSIIINRWPGISKALQQLVNK